jgi:hypothetical protein
MNDITKIGASHLGRAAYIYLRQSTPSQVEHNRESTQRQYALAARATTLGWPSQQVIVVDEDLGLSGSGIVERNGFARLTAESPSAMSGSCSASKFRRRCRRAPTRRSSNLAVCGTRWKSRSSAIGSKMVLACDRTGIQRGCRFFEENKKRGGSPLQIWRLRTGNDLSCSACLIKWPFCYRRMSRASGRRDQLICSEKDASRLSSLPFIESGAKYPLDDILPVQS